MKRSGYEYIDHTADVQARCYGTTLEKAFEQAVYSLMATISPNLEKVKALVNKSIIVKAEDKQALLFDFLTEFLYIFDVEGLIFSQIIVKKIKKKENGYLLVADARGEKFDRSKHEIGIEVKAITYSYMNIEENVDNVIIDVIFDI
jgi:SHS2 domain-containing protein